LANRSGKRDRRKDHFVEKRDGVTAIGEEGEVSQKPNNIRADPDAFLLQIQSPAIRTELIKLARSKHVPESDREDIASETIAEAIRKRTDYDPERGSVRLWVMIIGKNIIGSYWRTQTAKKRKPEGGVISLDAESDKNGGSRTKPGDAVADTRHSVSEEVQHYIETAKLSEKEANAIAHRLDKKSKKTGEKISSSTTRRGIKKLKQVRNDEKFLECPRGPESSECAYGLLPPPEHNTALLYDALRRISWFVDAIARWRSSPTWKNVQAFLDAERAAKRFPLAISPQHWPEPLSHYRQVAHDRDPELRRRFEAAVEMALAFSEWPRVAYCRLDPNERRQRLEQFGWHFAREPFWEIDERTFEFFLKAADDLPDPRLGLAAFLQAINKAPQNASDTYSSVHLVRIDRRYPPKTLVESFNKWAGAKLKATSKTIKPSGRRRTRLLVGFACVRLMDEFGLNKADAMSWLKSHFGGTVPSTPERLERAARATRDALKDFLPSPTEIGV
jgi:DNA-directed RNA polymerase specialized sigma24 family protein